MFETWHAVVATVVALLPGAIYVFSFERRAGAWGVKLADRVLRFVAVSAVLHALALPLELAFYREFVAPGRLSARGGPVIAIWLAALGYVAVPAIIGSVMGNAFSEDRRWALWLAGRDRAPRAWEHLWSRQPTGIVRLRLKSGGWIAGVFGDRNDGTHSYAGGFPENGDLYLATALRVDAVSGKFDVDATGNPVPTGSGLLVKWEDVEYLDFIAAGGGVNGA